MKSPEKSFWFNSLLYTLLQRFSLFFFGVASFMILVRGFSTETNGVWALFITLFSLFEAVKQGLLRNASIKFLGLPAYANKKNAVQSASLLINLLFSLLVIFLIFLSANVLSVFFKTTALASLLVQSSVLILLLIPYNHCEIILQANYRFPVLFTATFIRQALFFSGVLILYYYFHNRFTLAYVLLLQMIALAGALIYILAKSYQDIIHAYTHDPAIVSKLFHFGKFTFGTNLFAGLSRSFDHLITANALSPLEGKNFVAYYNTVARVNNMVDMPSLAAADVLYPKNVKALEEKGLEKVKYYFEQMVGTLLALIIPLSLFLFIFPRQIISIIAGPDYYPAAPILQLTILFSIVRPLSYQFGSTLDAIGKPHINFRVNALLMIFNLILTYLAIKIFGGMGAAYATMFYYIVSFLVMIFILKKHIQADLKNILFFCIGRYKEFFHYTAKYLRRTNGS